MTKSFCLNSPSTGKDQKLNYSLGATLRGTLNGSITNYSGNVSVKLAFTITFLGFFETRFLHSLGYPGTHSVD